MNRWTFMVYMAGNNDLAQASDTDIKEIRSVTSPGGIGRAVFVRRQLREHVPGPARRFLVGDEGEEVDAEELGDVDSGDPKTVLEFARWAMRKLPAERYAVILWNHGSGYEATDFDQLYTEAERSSLGVRAPELNARSKQPVGRLFFSTSVHQIMTRPTESERAILSDDATGHSLDSIELRKLMEAIKKDLGRPVDLLGMDACLMSTFEVAYELVGLADVIVGSEELEPNAGWPYNTILRSLVGEPTQTAEQLGRSVVRNYVDSYAGERSQWPVTQAAVRPSAAGQYGDALDGLVDALDDHVDESWPKIDGAAGRSAHLAESYGFELVDVKSFAGQLLGSTLPESVKTAAQTLEDLHAPGAFILSEGHLGDRVASCGGTSIYYPGTRRPISPYYGDLRLSQQRKWADLLRHLAEARINAR